MCCCLVLQVSGKCRSSRNWASYSSSHKDWSCWAGLHPPSKADAVYAIPSRAPRLRVHQTGSRGGAEARRARAGLARSVRRGCTRRWKRALHVPPRGGAVGGTACRAPTPVAGSGRLAQRGRPGRGSTYLRTAIKLDQPLIKTIRSASGSVRLLRAGCAPWVRHRRRRQQSPGCAPVPPRCH